MWSGGGGGGGGGDIYWGRKEKSESRGIAVIFAWASIQDRHLRTYVDLYASLRWNSLVCHADFLNAYVPSFSRLQWVSIQAILCVFLIRNVFLFLLMVNYLCRFYPERAMSLAFVVLNELVEVSLVKSVLPHFQISMKRGRALILSILNSFQFCLYLGAHSKLLFRFWMCRS